MYLLEGHKPPDHKTLARYRPRVLRSEAGEDLLRQIVELLIEVGYVDMSDVFIDGTKIEANANRYAFVSKKAAVKNQQKLRAKIAEQLPGLPASAGVKYRIQETEEIAVRYLKKIRKKLYEKNKAEGIEFVHGTGKRKTAVQRAVETVDEWLEKLMRYTLDIHICGKRKNIPSAKYWNSPRARCPQLPTWLQALWNAFAKGIVAHFRCGRNLTVCSMISSTA